MTVTEQKQTYDHIPDKIFRNSLPLVCKALRGEAPTGPWTPYSQAIQLGVDEAYAIVGYWPNPVVIESPLTTSIKILKMAQERPFSHGQALKFLCLVNSLWHKFEFWSSVNTGYWTS